MKSLLEFKKAFDFVYKATGTSKSDNYIFNYVQVKRENHKILIYGTNGVLWVETEVDVSDKIIFGDIDTFILSRQQLKLLLSSVKDVLDIESNPLLDVIKDSSRYPSWPNLVYRSSFNFLPSFYEGLSVSYAVPLKDNQSYFTHVNITSNTDGYLEYVGTNRHRISIYRTNKQSDLYNILIPIKVAKFLFKQKWIDLNMSSVKVSDDNNYFFIEDSKTKILIKTGDSSFFPSYEKLFYGISDLRVFAVNKKKLLDGLSTVKLTFDSALTVLFDSKDKMTLGSRSGDSRSYLPCQCSSGGAISFNVNFDYFLEAVKATRGKNIKISTNGGDSKILITGDDEWQQSLIQPIVDKFYFN